MAQHPVQDKARELRNMILAAKLARMGYTRSARALIRRNIEPGVVVIEAGREPKDVDR